MRIGLTLLRPMLVLVDSKPLLFADHFALISVCAPLLITTTMARNNYPDNANDDATSNLPAQTLKRIDDAFDRAVAERFRGDQDQRPSKRRRIAQDEPTAGGFLLDDDDDDNDDDGGFIPESSNNDEEKSNNERRATHLPLSLIPDALQRLDFDPSDADVLSVFASAASAWGGNVPSLRRAEDEDDDDGEQERDREQEQFVSRADWHAVCAALFPFLSASASASTNDGNGNESPLSSLDSDSDSNSDSTSNSDLTNRAEFQESESSEDEYVPEPKPKPKSKPSTTRPSRASTSHAKPKPKKPRKKKSLASTSSSSSDSDPNTATPRARPLTARQKEDTLATYALFFPSSSKSSRSALTEAELARRQLTIRDVASAAASIKEKITAEEVRLALYCISDQADY